jgi:hypothetical protein
MSPPLPNPDFLTQIISAVKELAKPLIGAIVALFVKLINDLFKEGNLSPHKRLKDSEQISHVNENDLFR